MGVTVQCKKTGRSLDMGYGGFNRWRSKIAELYDHKKQPKRVEANYKRAAKLGNVQAQQWCVKHGVAY